MKEWDWTIHEKPHDLRERLFLFACLTVRVVQYLHTRGRIAVVLSEQILKSGTSAGANYEEADDGSSDADKLAKRKIALRELKETSFRLRVLRRVGILRPEHDPVINENAELIKILATVIRNSKSS
jgi:four helix bundle protein